MKKQLNDLACRRRLLLEKINIQRMEVPGISLQLQKPLALVDAGVKTVHFIRIHPMRLTGGSALLLARCRRNLRHMMQDGWRLLFPYPAKFNGALHRAKGCFPFFSRYFYTT